MAVIWAVVVAICLTSTTTAQNFDLPTRLPANQAAVFADPLDPDDLWQQDVEALPGTAATASSDSSGIASTLVANLVPRHTGRWYAGGGGPWGWKLLPAGIIYRSYLAGVKESRMATSWVREQDTDWKWETTLGGRVGILRYGTDDEFYPEGWQLDIEGSAQVRLDIEEERDVDAVDFRAGIPLTWREGPWEAKFGYYHLSSHAGDEFLLKNPGFMRINFSRDALVAALAYRPTPELRLYGEAGWAMYSDVSEPWEFQFGIDYAPFAPTGIHGAPFAAINGHLREEVDFGGHMVVQAGWAWRGTGPGRLFRFGVEYFNGKSRQFQFFNEHEQQVGLGLWYDY